MTPSHSWRVGKENHWDSVKDTAWWNSAILSIRRPNFRTCNRSELPTLTFIVQTTFDSYHVPESEGSGQSDLLQALINSRVLAYPVLAIDRLDKFSAYISTCVVINSRYRSEYIDAIKLSV